MRLNPRNQFKPASFREVPFHVSVSDTAVGRRTVLHEFPLKDVPYTEDMGRKASEFVVDGFLIGDNYLLDMKLLIAALTAYGPGTLVHPTMGTMNVSLAHPARLREQFIDRRGMVSFSLTFIESDEIAQPSFKVDTQQRVVKAADAVYVPMRNHFTSRFSTAGAPAWSVQSVVDEISSINDVTGKARTSMQFDLTSLSDLSNAQSLPKSNPQGLLATPNDLFTALSDPIRAMVSLFDFSGSQNSTSSFGSSAKPSNPMRTLLPLAKYGYAELPGSHRINISVSPDGHFFGAYFRESILANTPVRRQQATNQSALFELVAQCAVVEAVRSSIYLPFVSVEESVAVRELLYDALDDLMMDAADDVYSALHDLRSAMVRDITARGADLVQFAEMTLSASAPAQVLSYRLYQAGGYAAELVKRNQAAATVMHPLFVPGGIKLEVRRGV